MALPATRRRRVFVLLLPALLVLAGGVGAVAWLGAASGRELAMSGGVSVTVRVSFGRAAARAPVEKSVSVEPGASVLDAVKAAGVRVTTTDEAKGESCCGAGMVHALDGVASDEKTRSGWMYAVNGSPPTVGPAAMSVNGGDVIEWTYR